LAGRTSGAATCVALDLGATTVRAVEVEWVRAGGDATAGRVVKRGSAALPPNAWNDLVAHREAFAAAISEALRAGGISARSVVASLPRRLVTVRFARLPHAPPEQMRGMVAFEAQQYILFSLDEVILDYHVPPELASFTASGGDDMDLVLLAAVRRTLVADLTAIFDRAGLELERLAVSALALAEHVRSAIEPTAVIDIEPDELDVAVVADGRLLFTRASALHTENILPEIALRRVVEEVARSFTAYQNEFRHQPLAHVYLAGGSVSSLTPEEIERTLSDVVDMPVTYLPARLLDPTSRAYAVAAGAALQTRGDSIAPINLYPNERAVLKAQTTKRQRFALLGVLVVALAAGGIYFGMNKLDARAKEWKETVSVNKELQTITAQMEAREKAQKRQTSFETELKDGLDREHPAVDVIAALDNALPRNAAIWLTQFAFERDGLLTLRGESRSEMAATDLVIALQKSGAFTDVRLGYLGDAQDTASRGATETSAPVTSAPTAITPNTSGAPAPGGGAAPAPGQPPAGQPGPPPGLPGIPGAVPPPGSVPPGAVPGGLPTPNQPPAGGLPNPGTTAPATSAPRGTTPVTRTRAAGPPLTSFIITCRINQNAKTLLPPKRAVTAVQPGKNGKTNRPAMGNTADEGEVIEEMGEDFGDL
jgi:Tfp pilus assembly PilM family ATPase/Tfp pilus assembly protein PilN